MKGRTKILVTGKGAKGFTLLEVMVALVILSFIVGVVALSIPSRERSLESTVNSALGILKACRNNAIVSGREHGVLFHEQSSSLLIKQEAQWELVKRFTQPDGIQYQFAKITRDQDNLTPQVNCFSNGLVSQFSMCIALSSYQRCILSQGNGQFELQ